MVHTMYREFHWLILMHGQISPWTNVWKNIQLWQSAPGRLGYAIQKEKETIS